MKAVPIVTTDDALRAHEAGRLVQAFRALKRLSEQGDSSAFHMLGYLYDVGEGTRRNRKLAIYWYTRSYRAGRAISASNLATVYRDLDKPKAEFDWYQRAAAMGDDDATLEVAIRYLSGKGTRRSLARAIELLNITVRSKDASQDGRDVARRLLWGCERRKRGV
jgi:TPR repeat protein